MNADEMNEAPTFGERLRELRETRGYSRVRIVMGSERAITENAIWRIEEGYRNPRLNTLMILAQQLGLTFVIDSEGVAVDLDPAWVPPPVWREKMR